MEIKDITIELAIKLEKCGTPVIFKKPIMNNKVIQDKENDTRNHK